MENTFNQLINYLENFLGGNFIGYISVSCVISSIFIYIVELVQMIKRRNKINVLWFNQFCLTILIFSTFLAICENIRSKLFFKNSNDVFVFAFFSFTILSVLSISLGFINSLIKPKKIEKKEDLPFSQNYASSIKNAIEESQKPQEDSYIEKEYINVNYVKNLAQKLKEYNLLSFR